MKTKSTLAVMAVFGLVATSAWSTEDAKKSAPTASNPPKKVEPASSATSAVSADKPHSTKEKPAASDSTITEKLPPELAASKAIEEANEDHIRPASERYKMETPPPPLRTEKKPPMPAPGLVWVPGHWVPVKGEWQWTPGAWGVPATPISVWIDAKYDAKTKQWSAGYWQPDRPSPHRPDPPDRDATPVPKFF